MNFFQKIKASIYDKSFYKGLTEQTVSQSVLYIISLVFSLVLIYTAILSITVIPLVHKAKDFVLKSHMYYPDELVVTIKDGIVSTNVKEPYFIKTRPTDGTEAKNLVVIDTKNVFSENVFREYNTLFLVTNDSIITFDKNHVDFDKEGNAFLDNTNSAIKITKLTGMTGTTTVTKANIIKATDYISSKMGFVTPIGLTLILIGLFIFETILMLFFGLIGAFIVWIIEAKVFKKETNFDHSFKKALHLLTGVLILSTFVSILATNLTNIIYVAIFIVLAYINLIPEKTHKHPVHHHTHTEHKDPQN